MNKFLMKSMSTTQLLLLYSCIAQSSDGIDHSEFRVITGIDLESASKIKNELEKALNDRPDEVVETTINNFVLENLSYKELLLFIGCLRRTLVIFDTKDEYHTITGVNMHYAIEVLEQLEGELRKRPSSHC